VHALYIKATRDQKAVDGKYVVAHGVADAIKRYQKDLVTCWKKILLEVGEMCTIKL